MALERSGAAADLTDMQLFVPVCEFGVHAWKESRGREDASWGSMEEVSAFASAGLWGGIVGNVGKGSGCGVGKEGDGTL